MKRIKQFMQKAHKHILRKTTRVFYPFSIEEAQQMILSDVGGFKTDYRWKVETEEQMTKFKKWITPNASVLDFGIGIGRMSRAILKEFPSIEVYGIDDSKKMLTYCIKYIPKEYRQRLRLFHFGQFSRIKDNSIDFAFSLYVLQHVASSQFEKAIQELYRVIKPSGVLYLLNSNHRIAFDNKHAAAFDDGIDQLKLIKQYFEEKEDVTYESEFMKIILKSSFSKLFTKKLTIQ
ncbi:MAG: class I SAM-dependent methyltransferase [Candidatus Omnitrophica bacterium]|nr:class I SAM-dependent methyltransferase [Candidatus Omnitrophota bacterium]